VVVNLTARLVDTPLKINQAISADGGELLKSSQG
jgi:hypothetical protein